MEKEKSRGEPIEFKPLSTGLGFHPFSNGLPYTPRNGTPPATTPTDRPDYRNGAGATAAGAPRFVPPPKRTMPPVSPTATMPQQAPKTLMQQPSIAVASQKSISPETEARYGFGYLLSRCLAYSIDLVLNTFITFIALCFAFGGFRYSTLRVLMTPEMMILASLGIIVLNWTLITAQELLFHTTFGKKVFGLELPGRPTQILLRAVLFVPSTMCFGLGVLWALFDSKRACWHDRASNLQPTQLAKL